MLTTALKDIRAAGPCKGGWEKLLKHMGKTHTDAKHDDTEFSLAVVLESNGLDDALWVLDRAIKNRRICSLFAADCAESVLHIFEAAHPDDDRPRRAIEVARNPNATIGDRAVAWDAARAAERRAWAAAEAAAWAAWAAARAAAWDAAGAARAAGDAARAAARAAAGDVQSKRLAQYIEHGEAAAKMSWPEMEEA